MLPIEEFKNIVKNMTLIVIDFIIENDEGDILLGEKKK